MPDWVRELLYGPMYLQGKGIWDMCMGLITGVVSQSPQTFSEETWDFVEYTLYPWSLGIGILCVNLFFIIGFYRSISNFKENITLELCIEAMVRLVVCNVVLQSGPIIVKSFFTMAAQLAGQVFTFSTPEFYTGDGDFGAQLFWVLFGVAYVVVALVCGIMMLLTVYGRYIKLYMLFIFYPIACSAFIAGRGIEHTTYSYVKAFLLNVFEIVTIALTIVIAGKLLTGISFLGVPDALQGLDGFIQALHSLLSMILMTSAVKGVNSFMAKAFGL